MASSNKDLKKLNRSIIIILLGLLIAIVVLLLITF
jgi:FtsH-binding integral membrane protein